MLLRDVSIDSPQASAIYSTSPGARYIVEGGQYRGAGSAIIVTDAAELRAKLLAAIDVFAGGSGSAYFLQSDQTGGGYQRLESTLALAPLSIDENDDAVVEQRRAQGAVLLSDLGTATRAVGAALALPMAVHGRLKAFVLVGHKPQQELFRPDELALLARSVRSVGLDIEALRAEALALENAALRERTERLAFAIGILERGPQVPSTQGLARPRTREA